MTGPPSQPEHDRGSSAPPLVAGPWSGVSPRGRRTHSWNPAQESDWFDEPVALLELAGARRPGLARFVAPRAVFMAVILAALAAVGMLFISEVAGAVGSTVVIAVIIWVLWTGTWMWLLRNQILYAGAERLGDGESTTKIVGLYDLAEVALTGSGASTRLRLVGSNQVELHLPMGLVEANPALWGLVYYGLRHSASSGAVIDSVTRERLRLPSI